MSAYAEALYAVDEIIGYMEEKDTDYYGFIERMDVLSPSNRIEYIGKNKDFSPISITMGGGYSLGDWADFPLLVNNKPYMVHSSGIVDYELSATDYTKKVDGTTASDVNNTSYDGGAFSWLQKIYKKEFNVGSDRYVLFSMKPKDGFTAAGFIDSDNAELEGVWLPMFYGAEVTISSTARLTSIAGNTAPVHSKTTEQEKTLIDAFGSRAKFFGGAIVGTIQDLLIMWGKTTDLQGKYGYGNCNGYNSSDTSTYGKKNNAVVGGGQFYGTSDKTSLNKILHSVVIGTYNLWQRDPYTICVNGRIKVSKNYAYNLTASGYTDTGVQHSMNGGWYYPNAFKSEQGFGAIPQAPFKGSTSTGSCDGFYINIGITAVAIRFGGCGDDLGGGVRCLGLYVAATYADWAVGASVLLLAPAGAAPYAAT